MNVMKVTTITSQGTVYLRTVRLVLEGLNLSNVEGIERELLTNFSVEALRLK